MWHTIEDLAKLLNRTITEVYEDVINGKLKSEIEQIGSEQKRFVWYENENKDINTKLIQILSTHFQNGFLIYSYIEMQRLRKYYLDTFGEDIATNHSFSSDKEIEKAIIKCGTVIDGRAYIFDKEIMQRLQNLLIEYFETGAIVVFYDVFFEKNYDWLYAGNIGSARILSELVESMGDNISLILNKTSIFHSDYLSTEDWDINDLISAEIKMFTKDSYIFSLIYLANKLKYIAIEKIKYNLQKSPEYIKISENEYVYKDDIHISDNEKQEILNFVAKQCREQGYAQISELPKLIINSIGQNNSEIPQKTLYTAIYQKILSIDYSCKGNVLTPLESKSKKSKAPRQLMIEFCQKQEKCNFKEIYHYFIELHGVAVVRAFGKIMAIIYKTMVRIDKDTVVAENYVDFDVNKIDEEIAKQMGTASYKLFNEFSYSNFPYCGYNWNKYILESYCRKGISNLYEAKGTMNKSCNGVVVPKNSNLGYRQIMADSIVRDQIPLTENHIAEYLLNKEFVVRPMKWLCDEVIRHAQTIKMETK